MVQVVMPLIAAGKAMEYVHHPDVVFIDARGGADAYERYKAGHVPGALFFDLETGLSQKSADPAYGGRHPLPAPERFGVLLGEKGIKPSHHLIVYDDKYGSNAAARLWWMLKAVGHQKVQVIDGGHAAIAGTGATLSTGEEKSLSPAQAYPVGNWKLPLADIEMVERATTGDDYLIVDVRENYRYNGESEPIDLVAGHIPGAVNAPYLDNLAPDGRFRSTQALAKQFEILRKGREMQKLIVHCGSGVTACHTLLAMEAAGMSGAKLYVGSWSEWSRRKKRLSKGPNP